MPFTEKFFFYNPAPRDIAAETAKLQALYGNMPSIYFEDWLGTQSQEVQEAYARYTKTSTGLEIKLFIEAFKASPEYQKSWEQIETLIRAIQTWAVKNSIEHADNWMTLLERFPQETYILDEDMPKWLSSGKRSLEETYLLIEYSDITPLPQKKRVISQLSSPMGSTCSPGALSRIKDAPLDLLTDWPSRFMKARIEIVQSAAKAYLQSFEILREIMEGSEIHYVYALRNYVANASSIPVQTDILAPKDLLPGMLESFAEEAIAAIRISTITDQLTQSLLTAIDGNFSLENLEALKKLGRELNLLGKDPWLISNLGRIESNSGEDNEALCGWIFEENDEGEQIPRSPADITFLIQCTLIARLNEAGYLTEDTIQLKSLDDHYQLILLPSEMSLSWIQSQKTKTPPEPLEKFLARKPEYCNHEQIKICLNSFFEQKAKGINDIFHLGNILQQIPDWLRMPFLFHIKNRFPHLFINIDMFDLFELMELLPKDKIRMQFLKLVGKDTLIKIINTPSEEDFDLGNYLPEEDCVAFLELLDDIGSFLLCLLPIGRFSFLTANLNLCLDLIRHCSDLENILNCLEEEQEIAFLNLIGKDKLATVVDNILNLKAILTCLPKNKRFSFLEKNEDTWPFPKYCIATMIELMKHLPQSAYLPFLDLVSNGENITIHDVKAIIGILLNSYNNDPLSRITLQTFLHIKEIQPIVLKYNFKNLIIPAGAQYLIDSLSHRKAIEESIHVLEVKANFLPEKSVGRKAATLALVEHLKNATHQYFSKTNLANEKSAERYLAHCKKLVEQADVDPENRIGTYPDALAFDKTIGGIFVTIKARPSASTTFLVVPSVFSDPRTPPLPQAPSDKTGALNNSLK